MGHKIVPQVSKIAPREVPRVIIYQFGSSLQRRKQGPRDGSAGGAVPRDGAPPGGTPADHGSSRSISASGAPPSLNIAPTPPNPGQGGKGRRLVGGTIRRLLGAEGSLTRWASGARCATTRWCMERRAAATTAVPSV